MPHVLSSIKQFILAVVILLAGVSLSASSVTSVPVPGHVPIAAGEHPRLLFRSDDIGDLRARAQTPDGQLIVQRLLDTLGIPNHQLGAFDDVDDPVADKDDLFPTVYHPSKIAYQDVASMPEGAFSISHPAGFGMLYVLTGDTDYADLARQTIEWARAEGIRDRDYNARYSIYGSGELLRLGPSLGWTALAYDLCYNAWDQAYRDEIADYLLNYDGPQIDGRNKTPLQTYNETGEWPRLTMYDMVWDTPFHAGSNHYGAISGGSSKALLAIEGDMSSSDNDLIQTYLNRVLPDAYSALSGFGPRGFFQEGQGPSHMGAYPALLSFYQAMRNARGRDYRDSDALRWTALRWIGETISFRDRPNYPVRHEAMGFQYGTEDLISSGDLSGSGRFPLGFGAVNDEEKPYLLWMYENYFRDADNNRFDIVNYPHLAIAALVNWPIGVTPKHPEGFIPRAYRDSDFGHYVFRNGWNADETDIIVTMFTAIEGNGTRKPWDDNLPVKIWGFGQKVEFSSGWDEKSIDEIDFQTDDVTTVVRFEDGHAGTDFSGRAGVPGVFVTTIGDMDSGFSGNFLHQEVNGLQVFTMAPDENHPKVVADGDGVTLGGLHVEISNNRLVFSDAVTPNSEILNAYVEKDVDPALDVVSEATLIHPGQPDSLLSFDFEDTRNDSGGLYLSDTMGNAPEALAYNVRPDHFKLGVYGEAFPFRPDYIVDSLINGIDPEADAAQSNSFNFEDGILTAVELPQGDWELDGSNQTISFWLKLNEPRDGYALLLEPFGRGNYHFGFHPGPTLMTAGSMGVMNVLYPNDPDIWRHIAYVKDQDRKIISIYIDGEMAGRVKANKLFNDNTVTYIGGRRDFGEQFPTIAPVEGDMDEFALYNRSLTAGEVAMLAQSATEPSASLAPLRASNRAPIANFKPSTDVGATPLVVDFDSMTSFDPEDSNLTYSWDFGDGGSSSAANPQYTYLNEGEYVVTLTVTDDQGNFDKAFWTIKPANRAPLASVDVVSANGSVITLSAANSSDPDSQPLTYEWLGGPGGTQTGEQATFSLPAGSFELTLVATDTFGAQNSAVYTAVVLDSQGYRLPENPENLLPGGVHFQHWDTYRKETFWDGRDSAPDLRDPEWDFRFNLRGTGIVDGFNPSTLSGGGTRRASTFAGYVYIPADDTYTIELSGLRRSWLTFGNETVVTAQSKFGEDVFTVDKKLREGYHRVGLVQAGFEVTGDTTQNASHFWARVRMTNSSGETWVLNHQHLFRTPLPTEAEALGLPVRKGADLLSLGDPQIEQPVEQAGNTAPTITVDMQQISSFLETAVFEFTATVNDADGDPVTVTWLPGDGSTLKGLTIARQFSAGTHNVTAIARDDQGGETTVVVTPVVDEMLWAGDSIGLEYWGFTPTVSPYAAYPGETVGAIANSNWSILRRTGGNVHSLYGFEDQIGNAVGITYPAGDGYGPSKHMKGNPGKTGNDRLMRGGPYQMWEPGEVKNIPYAVYDVLIYTTGNYTKPAPSDAIYTPTGSQTEDEENPSELVIRVNGETRTYPAGETHRWGGFFKELNESQPDGNVAVFRDLIGTSIDFDLQGGMLNGVQIVEVVGSGQAPVFNSATSGSTTVTSNSTTLDADVSDPDGHDVEVTWIMASGPAGANPVIGDGASTTITFDKAGSYTLRAVAVDDFRKSAFEDVVVEVEAVATTVEVTPATILLRSGETQDFTASILDQFGQVSSPSGATINWTQAGGSLSATTGSVVTFTAGPVGGNTHYARATLTPGNLVGEASITTLEQTDPPVVTIISPVEGEGVPEDFDYTFTVDASDPDGTVTEVRFYLNGAHIGTDTTAPYSLNWTPGARGAYNLVATATDDKFAETTTDPRNFQVEEYSGGPVPIHDSFVDDGNDANRDFGAHRQIRLDSGSNRFGYVQFDLNWITETVNDATLSFNVETGGGSVKLYFVEDDAWTENSINFNNRPASGALVDTQPASAGSRITFDVSSVIETERIGDGKISFMLGGSNYLSSKDTNTSPENAPLLEINGGGEPVNAAPVVEAGSAQTIILPAGATLDGTVTDDGLPSGTLTYSWTQVSGAGTASFADAATEDTTVSFDIEGTYELQLEASDGVLSTTDTVTVTVQPNSYVNVAPSVEAGSDRTITLPANASLDATVSDDGLPSATLTYTWTQLSGAGTATFVDAGVEDATVSFDVAGTYVLRLEASDSDLSASDTVTVIVEPAVPSTPGLIAYWSLNSTTLSNGGNAADYNDYAAEDGEESATAVLDVSSGNQVYLGTNWGKSVNALNGYTAGAGLRMRERAEGYRLTMRSLDLTDWVGLELSYGLQADAADGYAHAIEYNLNDGNGWQTAVASQTYATAGWEVVTNDLSAVTAIEGASNVSLRINITAVANNSDCLMDNIQINGGRTGEAVITFAEQWRIDYGLEQDGSGSSGDEKDYDGGGSPNIFERAFMTDPSDSSDDFVPTMEMVEDEGNTYLTLTYRRLMGGTGTTGVNYTVDDLTYSVQYVNDLTQTWTASGITEVTVQDDTPSTGVQTVTVRMNTSVTDEDQSFMRLNVTAP